MRFTQWMRASGLGFTLLLSCGSAVFASSTTDYFQTDASITNTCLLRTIQENSYGAAEASNQLGSGAQEAIGACLDAALSQVTEDIEIAAAFDNPTFTNYVSLTGSFSFDLRSLEDGLISQEELNSFDSLMAPNENSSLFSSLQSIEPPSESCGLSGLEDFSYKLSESETNLLKVRSLLKVAESRSAQAQSSDEIAALMATLTSLQGQLGEPSESLGELSLNCTADNVTMTADAGVVDMTVTQHNNTNQYAVSGSYSMPENYSLPRNGWSYSTGSNGSTHNFSFRASSSRARLTVNGQSLTVATSKDGNRAQTSYSGIPVVISSGTVRLSPRRNYGIVGEDQSSSDSVSEASYLY